MGRSNLYTTGSEFLIHIAVRNHRNHSVRQRKMQLFSYDILISFILRVYSHRHISQESFRSCGGNLHKAAFLSHYRVKDVPEGAFLLLMQNLRIGNRGITNRTPVNHSGTTVNQTLFIQTDKGFQHRMRATLVHGKTKTIPVSGGTHLMELVDNTLLVLFLPLPGLFQEALSSQLPLINAHILQLIDNLYLCGNSGMIRSRLPQSLKALHSLKTNQGIL